MIFKCLFFCYEKESMFWKESSLLFKFIFDNDVKFMTKVDLKIFLTGISEIASIRKGVVSKFIQS